MKKDKGTKFKKVIYEPYNHPATNFVYRGLLNLEGIHHDLIEKLEMVEQQMAYERQQKDWNASHNPRFPSQHLLTVACDCMWCTTRIRGTLTWKRKGESE